MKAKLIADKLRHDKRILQAKKLLTSALLEAQKSFSTVKPPHSELSTQYHKLIEQMNTLRGRNLFYPYLASGMGKGCFVELADGSVKYDFITGIGVHYLGHGSTKTLQCAIDAALEDTLMQGNLQQSVSTLKLMDKLTKLACKKGAALTKCFLSSSGAMANENAYKIILQKKSPAHRFLAFRRCFSGRSMVAAQITDKPEFRQGLPEVLKVDYIPFYDHKNPQTSIEHSKRELNALLEKNKGEYAGMSFELIQGEGGYYPGTREFFIALMDILKKNNILILVDEIQTFGRTSELFAFQYYGLDEYVDIVTVGKMLHVCATLFKEEVNPTPALLSQTFTSPTVSIYFADMILDELIKGKYLGKSGKIMTLSTYFTDRLEGLSKKYPEHIRGPFGFGAMVACTVFDATLHTTNIFLKKLFHNGVLAFAAGKDVVRVRFLMPIGVVTKKDIDAVCTLLEKTLLETADELKEKRVER
jgi:4-aminobutyrate aminotransferase-like enzyme